MTSISLTAANDNPAGKTDLGFDAAAFAPLVTLLARAEARRLVAANDNHRPAEGAIA